MPQTNIAWALYVVSSASQEDTLQNQQAWAEETALKEGWQIGRAFDAINSGKNGPRKVVKALVAALEDTDAEHRPEILMLIRLDRLGRGLPMAVASTLAQIHELGVKIFTRSNSWIKLDTPTEQLSAFMLCFVGSQENITRIDKLDNAYSARRRKGQIAQNMAPYGLVFSDDKKSYKPKESKEGDVSEADVIRLMFRLRLEGYGYHRIANALNEMAPEQTFVSAAPRKTRWYGPRVSALLKKKNTLSIS